MHSPAADPAAAGDVTNGAYLNTLWGVGAAHALYNHDGHWYHPLKRFPGALFDRHGYLLFATEQEYRACLHRSIGKQISVPKPGISAIPGYVRVTSEARTASPFAAPDLDVDIHGPIAALEGRRHLVVHLERERNRSIVRKKKKSAASLAYEICKFSFKHWYGTEAADYCEVHHLVPFSKVEETTETRLEDLAVVCANCHRVIHLRNPPYDLEDIRRMLDGIQHDAEQGFSSGRATAACR